MVIDEAHAEATGDSPSLKVSSVGKDKSVLGFPRHKPQFFSDSAANLARATLVYGFGRDLATPVYYAIRTVVAIPVVRSALVSRVQYRVPCGDATFTALTEELGIAPSDSFVFYQSQWRVQRFAALVLRGGEVAGFLQVRPDDDSYPYPRSQAWAFHHPELRGEVAVGSWHGRLLEPLPILHKPFPWHDLALPIIADQASQVLVDLILPPGDSPEGWRPLHGDITPSNLRIDRRGRLWLIDWEMARWGPVAADLLRFAVAEGSLKSSEPRAIAMEASAKLPYSAGEIREAAAFWLADPIFDPSTSEREDMTVGKDADLNRGRVEASVFRHLVESGDASAGRADQAGIS